MDLVEAITSDRFPWLLREQPELASATDANGVSALLLACYHRRPEAKAALIAAGAPIGALEAAALGEVELLEGADLSVRAGDGFTPLHFAAFFGGAEAVRVILAAGALPDGDAVNALKVRPIHSAAAVSNHESVRLLLEAGADPNVRQQGGYTPLHEAAFRGHAELVRCCWNTEPIRLPRTRRGRSLPTSLASAERANSPHCWKPTGCDELRSE